MLKFGDTFKYQGKDYVHLAKTEEIYYLAEILNTEYSEWLNEMYKKKIMNPEMIKKISQMPVYCFVMLKTKDFEGRAAHFYSTEKGDSAESSDAFFEPIGSLDKSDLKQILAQIRTGPVPRELKELTVGIEIE